MIAFIDRVDNPVEVLLTASPPFDDNVIVAVAVDIGESGAWEIGVRWSVDDDSALTGGVIRGKAVDQPLLG
ncbi:hypothetical protein AUJ42_01605 [Candidatus Collierbacteria bacterium CG1_02_44_10]|uniref:Uncharacterized protein n=4 Tax=Candidatus Collieribacteriota TaxID=1752725 RepID=A0A2H0DVE9_9BACT|nr:MAG: hypothetical protein AUJ42_01605 [Candidatus Collierbacteria bacterium CG1_02_44_10]PIP86146.1 MAG: hypothetical protein COW83_00460 [Candidatus Collierbacteria bacterium CG22_combo_CG10-13_8_21_14_all_43_12]PIR99906.1 MAG: hypothetical protein COT86_01400 [Candidatus Collierbacteria bacterium CG10_big_fil_rev_8_21_14_0_10_43_36]PIZ24235.1 MAG: hypothetical protein COY48_04020 [Candidatus Collierbacteria bacterium CG_4_10_14_0_8_um_filter_43_86]PJB48275.1 MAG: hypothetical protein CO104